uniref:Fanconi anemia core complex-associated protein 24 n=1 Tax=Jaculus jaculus TaxID=51337 RepID=A0A8C5NYB0_JACJA
MDWNPADGTGPVHVPLGHVVANEKWRGSQLAQEMQGHKPWQFPSHPPFPLCNSISKTESTKTACPPEGAPVPHGDFPFQVQEQAREPSRNPFLRKRRSVLSEASLVRTVQQIPGVGRVKAPLLLQRFSSIQRLSNASIQELEPVVGQAAAQHIHAFFTQLR